MLEAETETGLHWHWRIPTADLSFLFLSILALSFPTPLILLLIFNNSTQLSTIIIIIIINNKINEPYKLINKKKIIKTNLKVSKWIRFQIWIRVFESAINSVPPPRGNILKLQEKKLIFLRKQTAWVRILPEEERPAAASNHSSLLTFLFPLHLPRLKPRRMKFILFS